MVIQIKELYFIKEVIKGNSSFSEQILFLKWERL